MIETYSMKTNFPKSGQGEHDVFTEFFYGQPIMSYMHCVFKPSPTLKIVERDFSDGTRAECGLEGSEVAESTDVVWNGSDPRGLSSHGTKRKTITDEGLKDIANSLTGPV